MAGNNKLNTDAATITPAAKPESNASVPAAKPFLTKNTQAAPKTLPAKGIIITYQYACIFKSTFTCSGIHHPGFLVNSVFPNAKKVRFYFTSEGAIMVASK